MAKATGASAKRVTRERDLEVKNIVSVFEDVEGYSAVRVNECAGSEWDY
jgi:hypothetical protein